MTITAALKEGEVNLGVSFVFNILFNSTIIVFVGVVGSFVLQTTIMACQFEGGVIVAADSRTTTGSYIANRVTNKLTPVHNRIICCRSGSAADTQALADIVANQCELLR